MRLSAALILLPLATQAINIVLGNDDGWAEKNIRVLYDALTASGQNVVISAPAVDRSGTGTSMPTAKHMLNSRLTRKLYRLYRCDSSNPRQLRLRIQLLRRQCSRHRLEQLPNAVQLRQRLPRHRHALRHSEPHEYTRWQRRPRRCRLQCWRQRWRNCAHFRHRRRGH